MVGCAIFTARLARLTRLEYVYELASRVSCFSFRLGEGAGAASMIIYYVVLNQRDVQFRFVKMITKMKLDSDMLVLPKHHLLSCVNTNLHTITFFFFLVAIF